MAANEDETETAPEQAPGIARRRRWPGLLLLALAMLALGLALAWFGRERIADNVISGQLDSLGLPGVLAYATIFAALAGGLALILGVATRAVSLAMIPVLLGATWVHSGNGWVFSSEGGGWEFPLFWAIVQGAVALLGSGAYALKPSARGLATA